MRFYRDGLGLRVSDFIDLDMGGTEATRVAFFHCGPRHHSVAIAQMPAPRRQQSIALTQPAPRHRLLTFRLQY